VEPEGQPDIVLYNLNPQIVFSIRKLFAYKKNNPKVPIIARLDGPIISIRDTDSVVDKIFFFLIKNFFDGVIYQSNWSLKKNRSLGLGEQKYETLIHNGSDQNIFYPKEDKTTKGPIKIICTSWSPNLSKGFGIYKYLDESLDFKKYSFEFVGNTPYEFKNIVHTEPLGHKEMSDKLRSSDIFITASENDPCSNSLIEGLSCGLPAVVLNGGGHPELVGSGGVTFEGKEDVIQAIDKVADNIRGYKKNIDVETINSAALKYKNFLIHVSEEKNHNRFKTKRLSWWVVVVTYIRRFEWFCYRIARRIYEKITNK